MGKILAIAGREYAAAVKTKAFVISVLLLPVMIGLTFALRKATDGYKDDRVRSFAVVDHAGVYDEFESAVAGHDRETGTRWKLQKIDSAVASEMNLSDRVRDGELAAYLTIDAAEIQMHAVGMQDVAFRAFADRTINELLRARRLHAAGLNPQVVDPLLRPIPLTQAALARLDPATGKPTFDPPLNDVAAIVIPLGLSIIMFLVVIVSAIPMMQGVIEEKQQRIAEVLLASVRPFELMTGKIIGMFAVSATLFGIYASGGIFAAISHVHLISQYVTPATLGWFIAFQILAVLMFGSMYIAIGASCSDMREAQALMLPLNLLIMLPLLLLENTLEHPGGSLARWSSFFPTAAPFLTIARIAAPPGIPLWEEIVPMVIVLLTTILFIWAAGRIFRIGMMAGRSADWKALIGWMIRG